MSEDKIKLFWVPTAEQCINLYTTNLLVFRELPKVQLKNKVLTNTNYRDIFRRGTYQTANG